MKVKTLIGYACLIIAFILFGVFGYSFYKQDSVQHYYQGKIISKYENNGKSVCRYLVFRADAGFTQHIYVDGYQYQEYAIGESACFGFTDADINKTWRNLFRTAVMFIAAVLYTLVPAVAILWGLVSFFSWCFDWDEEDK